jgi:hypothetical protein
MIEGCQINATADFFMCGSSVVMTEPTWTYSNTVKCHKLKSKMYEKYIIPVVGLGQALEMYNNVHKQIVMELQSAFMGYAVDNNFVTIFHCSGGGNPCASAGNTIKLKDCRCWCRRGR